MLTAGLGAGTPWQLGNNPRSAGHWPGRGWSATPNLHHATALGAPSMRCFLANFPSSFMVNSVQSHQAEPRRLASTQAWREGAGPLGSVTPARGWQPGGGGCPRGRRVSTLRSARDTLKPALCPSKSRLPEFQPFGEPAVTNSRYSITSTHN